MTDEQKEAVRQLLRDELTLQVSEGASGDFYSNDRKVVVKLVLGQEVISEDYFTFTPGERPSSYY